MAEQIPGSWNNENPAAARRRRKSFAERLAEDRKHIREQTSPERVNRIMPTENLRRVLSSIEAKSLPPDISAGMKKLIALETRERGLLDDRLLREYPTVYIGSGIDVEYPLALGARKLVMLDPSLDSERAGLVTKKLRGYVSDVEENGSECRFQFDFGSGPEEVSVTLAPDVFVDGADFRKEPDGPDRFVPPERVGMFLCYQSVEPSQDPEAFERLVSGGYVVSNFSLASLHAKYFESHPSPTYDEFIAAHRTPGEAYADIYRANGLEPLTLSCEADNSQFVFLRKR